MLELKPCPFCGDIPTAALSRDWNVYITCKNCGITQLVLEPGELGHTNIGSSSKEVKFEVLLSFFQKAAERWNTRYDLNVGMTNP